VNAVISEKIRARGLMNAEISEIERLDLGNYNAEISETKRWDLGNYKN